MHVDGVYQWRDVAKVARKNNVWVATGGTPSVGAIGGWSQGGGHGPATNAVGWGVDQILEAEVLLADGRIVTANACENSDLYRSLRGGGPGYGIVLSMFVKAHANVNNITAHRLTIVPGALDTNKSEMIDAITDLVQQVPGLVDGGLGGYASWWKDFPTAVIGNSTSGYSHGIYAIGQNETATRATIESVVESLRQKHNSSLQINSTYVTYSDYWTFYYGEMGLDAPESNTTIMTSRAINRDHVSNTTAVRDLVDTLTDAPGQYNSQVLIFVGGRQVAQQGTDPFAGYHPAWRKASFGWVNVRVVPLSATQAERHATDEDMLSRTALMERFAPGTGAYMNEADRQDPNYIQNFYGDNYGSHLATKNKYDPNNVFYCATCVGSESFIEKPDGPLCMI
jgi:FAD/FMN-containing dehydrogenase